MFLNLLKFPFIFTLSLTYAFAADLVVEYGVTVLEVTSTDKVITINKNSKQKLSIENKNCNKHIFGRVQTHLETLTNNKNIERFQLKDSDSNDDLPVFLKINKEIYKFSTNHKFGFEVFNIFNYFRTITIESDFICNKKAVLEKLFNSKASDEE